MLVNTGSEINDYFYLISFPFQGMFEVPNVKRFQDSMHYLLSIVEPEKCMLMIPWPLLDKKEESQFRIAVKTILMEINDVCECDSNFTFNFN
jgi:hypothetical protein